MGMYMEKYAEPMSTGTTRLFILSIFSFKTFLLLEMINLILPESVHTKAVVTNFLPCINIVAIQIICGVAVPGSYHNM